MRVRGVEMAEPQASEAEHIGGKGPPTGSCSARKAALLRDRSHFDVRKDLTHFAQSCVGSR
jgi:hypothetical protein